MKRRRLKQPGLMRELLVVVEVGLSESVDHAELLRDALDSRRSLRNAEIVQAV